MSIQLSMPKILDTIGTVAFHVSYRAIADYGIAKVFMNTPARTAAFFGIFEGIATHTVVKAIKYYITNVENPNREFSIKFGKVLVIATLFFASFKAEQLILTFAGYPISFNTAAKIGLANCTPYAILALLNPRKYS